MRARRLAPGLGLGVLFVLSLSTRDAHAWVYSEHRQIAGEAIARLDPERRARLDALWAEARRGHEDRLCESPWAGPQGKTASCVDFAAFSALAGDHSCSADDLVANVLAAPWVLPVQR